MAYVSTAKASPHPPAQLASEWLYLNMWHQILNFFSPNISVVTMEFQYIFFDWPIFSNGVEVLPRVTLRPGFIHAAKIIQAQVFHHNRKERNIGLDREPLFVNKPGAI